MDSKKVLHIKQLNGSVLRLAVPSILANITIPLVGMVDVAIMGHVSDAVAVAGIAIGTMLFDLLYWNFGFLRVGTSGMTAQAYGRGGELEHAGGGECGVLLKKALRVALFSAVAWLVLQWLFVKTALAVIPCTPDVAHFASQYFFIRIWASPATMMLMALKGWFIGMQNTKAPMVTDMVVNVVNMLASYVLAVGVHTSFVSWNGIGVIGVAWGTLIAQYLGLMTAGVILYRRYRGVFKTSASGMTVTNTSIWRLNIQLIIRSLSMQVVYVGYTSLASSYGDEELAVSNILMKYFMLFSYFVDGFAYAGEALVGKEGMEPSAEGKCAKWQKTTRVKETVRVLFAWSTCIGVLFSLIYGVGAEQMVALMTNDVALQTAAHPYYLWLALMPVISALAFMWDGVFIGATDGKAIRNVMVLAAVAFVMTYLLGFHWMGIQALYLAYFMHLLVRTIYLSGKWTHIN